MAFFTRLLPRREFALPQFDLAPLAFELEHREEEGELADRASIEGHPKVAVLRAAARTPGELRESIERHLRSARDDSPPLLAQDAVDELRAALAELRRSLA